MLEVLITGGTGQLGCELLDTAPTQVAPSAPGREELDLLDRQSIENALDRYRPGVVINAAAYTGVDRAEDDGEVAFAVNANGPGLLGAAAAAQGARTIHVSTDYVFASRGATAWKPDDKPEPLGVYGASKLEGERRLSQVTGGKALILRTAWLYSRYGRNFVRSMLDLMAEKSELRVVADQIGSPTWANGLARAIWRAVEIPTLDGIHHWTDAGETSWHGFALAIQEEALALGLLSDKIPIHPIASADYPSRAARPAFSVLDTTATRRALAMEPSSWRGALKIMLRQLTATPNRRSPEKTNV